MPVEIKSLRENADQILIDVESKTNQDTPLVDVAYNRIISNAIAAQTLTGQLHNIDQRKECFPQTASENIGLLLWAELTNRPRGTGDQAELQATATGTNGTTIGTGSTGPTWKASNGIQFGTKTGGTIAGGTVSIVILATQSGTEGTLQVGDEVKLTSTIPGIDTVATITAINVPGSEPEDVDSWRSAIVQIAAFPPQIGTSAWFYNESLGNGITRAYPYSDQDYPGRVEIFAVADDNVDGLPTVAQLTAIEDIFTTAGKDVLWATGLLPNTDKRIEAFASPIDIYNVVITDGTPPLSATLKEKLETSIENYFQSRNPYIKGLSLEDTGVVASVEISAVMQNTIDSEVGDTGRFTDVGLEKQGSAAADIYTLEAGHRAKPNISYT